MNCPVKHTRPADIPNDALLCPKCGARETPTKPGWVVTETAAGADDACVLLHDDDEMGCMACEYGMSGKAFAAYYRKKADLVLCPACKGAGVVKKT